MQAVQKRQILFGFVKPVTAILFGGFQNLLLAIMSCVFYRRYVIKWFGGEQLYQLATLINEERKQTHRPFNNAQHFITTQPRSNQTNIEQK